MSIRSAISGSPSAIVGVPAIGATFTSANGRYWTPAKIAATFLFFAEDRTDILNKAIGDKIYNQVHGATDYLTVTGTGLNAVYETPITPAYKAADKDFAWWKQDLTRSRTDGNRLIGYDLQSTPIKYSDDSPNTIQIIAIIKSTVTLSARDLSQLYRYFRLPIMWNGLWSDYGYAKSNRPFDEQILWTAELEPPSSITLVPVSDEEMDLSWPVPSPLPDYISLERSTDGVNFAEIIELAGSVYSYPNIGLTGDTQYFYRIRSKIGSTYSAYSDIVNDITFYAATLTYTGNGTGVATLRLKTDVTHTVTLTGTARFYTDAAGTLNESTTWSLTSGALRTIYLKCPSSTAKLLIKVRHILELGENATTLNGWASSTNAPNLAADLSKFIIVTHISLTGTNTLSGDFSGLTQLVYFYIPASGATASADVTNLIHLTMLTYQAAAGSLTGDVTNINPSGLDQLKVTCPNTLHGTITNKVASTLLQATGTNTCGGEIAENGLITSLSYFYFNPSGQFTYSSTGHNVWANLQIRIYPVAGSGMTVAHQSNMIIDIANSPVGPTSQILYFLGSNISMADTNQGGIWGDFSGAATPSALAIAYKFLIRTRTNTLAMNGIAAPGGSGDGTGFPAGFGNWYRS